MTYPVRGAARIKCVDIDKNGLMHLLLYYLLLFLQNGCDIRRAFPLRICEQRAGLSAARRRGAAGELRHGPEPPETAAGAGGGRARGDPAAGPAVQVRWYSIVQVYRCGGTV